MDELAEADDDQPPKSALAWQLPERLQMPRSVGRRCFPAQDVEIAVICADFVKGILWAVPLVQYFLDHVLVPVQPKANRPFVRCPPGIAIHFQLHLLPFSRLTYGSIYDRPPTPRKYLPHLLSGEIHAEP